MFAALCILAIAACLGHFMAKKLKPTPRFYDGGALVVGLVFAGMIGAAVYEKKVHNNKQLDQVQAALNHQMCDRAKIPCTNYVPKETDIPSAENRSKWIDNAGKTTLPF